MATAIRIYEGTQSVEGLLRDLEVDPWAVRGLEGSQKHDVKAARDVIGVSLGEPWKGDTRLSGGLMLQEKRFVQWIGPTEAHFLLIYTPPGRFGSLKNKRTIGRNDTHPHELPIWSLQPFQAGPGEAIENYQIEKPVIIGRGVSTRGEYRTRPSAEKERIISASEAYSGYLFLLGAILGVSGTGHWYQFTGGSTQETSRGTIAVTYWFTRKAAVRAIKGEDISSPVDLPSLGSFHEYQIDKTGPKPVVGRVLREKIYFGALTTVLPGL